MIASKSLATLLVPLPVVAFAQEAEAPSSFVFTFGWPSEGSVRVLDEALKQGRESETAFTLQWAPDRSTGLVKVEFVDFEFLKYAGTGPTAPGFEAALKMVRPLTAAIPALYIDAEGRLAEIGSIDEVLERVGDLIDASLDEQQARMVRSMLSRPDMQAQMRTGISEDWSAWCGFWVDFEAEFDADYVLEMGADSVFPEGRVEIGAPQDHRGVEAVRATMTTIADPDKLLLAVSGMLDLVTAGADDSRVEAGLAKAMENFEEVSRVGSFGALYALEDLRPLVIATSTEVSIREKGQEAAQTQLEEHTYTFEWPDLEGFEAGK